MGIFRSFMGSIFAQAARDNKKEQERLNNWNALFDEAFDLSLDFGVFLENLGIENNYVMPSASDLADSGKGAINTEKRKIEALKRKINEFISLGGKPNNIWFVDKIDEYISRIKYLRSNGYLDNQDDWIQMDMEMLQALIPMDVEAKRIMNDAMARKAAQEQREALVKSVGFDVDTLSGTDFEAVCQTLVEKMGFTTQTTKTTGDGGIDIIAHNSQPLLSGKYIIQCKRYSGSVGEPILRDLYGVVTSERANKGILMTTGYFTRPAISFAEDKPLELIDGAKLRELMEAYLKDDYRVEGILAKPYQPVTAPTVVDNPNNNGLRASAPPQKELNIPPEYEWLREELEQEPDWYSDNENKVELSDFMTIPKYKIFTRWMDEAKRDPYNLSAKCRAIEVLHDSMTTRLRMGSRTIEEIHAVSNLLRTLIASVKKNEYKTSADEEKQYLYYMCLILEGEVSFWMGHLEIAVKCWREALEDFAFLDNGSKVSQNVKATLIPSIWTCLIYLEKDDEFEEFCQMHYCSIGELVDMYQHEAEKDIDENDFFATDCKKSAQKQYDVFANPREARCIVATSLTGLDDEEESSTLLCEGDNTIFKCGWCCTVQSQAIEFDSRKNIYYMGSDEDVNSPFYSKFLLVNGA